MNESEFRDWARRAQGDFNERLKALEARPLEGVLKVEVPGKVQGEMVFLAGRLLEEVRAGRVAGLAIAYLTLEGKAMTGWAEGSHGAFTLSGAASFVGLEMLESIRERERREEAAGAAQGETDEGKPRARELAGSAPAEDMIAAGNGGGKV